MNQLRLLVATEDGILYIYNIDSNEGGDLVLYKQHRLDGGSESPSGKNSSESDGGKSAPVNIEGAESDKMRTMLEATETPPKDSYQNSYEQDYPPLMTQGSTEWENAPYFRDLSLDYRCRMTFATVVLIHLVVRLAEDLVVYMLDLNIWIWLNEQQGGNGCNGQL